MNLLCIDDDDRIYEKQRFAERLPAERLNFRTLRAADQLRPALRPGQCGFQRPVQFRTLEAGFRMVCNCLAWGWPGSRRLMFRADVLVSRSFPVLMASLSAVT